MQRPQPVLQAHQELAGVQAGKHPAERIVRRDAVGQFEEPLEPELLGEAEPLHIGPTIRAADRSAERDADHVKQQVLLAALDARIGQIFKP
jgi:hypothetical protein